MEHDFKFKSFTKLFNCDGCKQQGSGPRYRCDHCGYELHKECHCGYGLHKEGKFSRATTSHDLFRGVIFQFHMEPQLRCGKLHCDDHNRRCDACGKDILGFNYQSVDKMWDLHPCCSKLEKKMLIEDTLFELRKKVLSSCIWCQEKKISGGKRGWSYVSRRGDYHFHVYCLMEMMHHGKASIEGDNNLALEKIELRHLAYKSKKNRKRGSAFLSTIKIFLKTILSILLGDPTALLASALIELIANG